MIRAKIYADKDGRNFELAASTIECKVVFTAKGDADEIIKTISALSYGEIEIARELMPSAEKYEDHTTMVEFKFSRLHRDEHISPDMDLIATLDMREGGYRSSITMQYMKETEWGGFDPRTEVILNRREFELWSLDTDGARVKRWYKYKVYFGQRIDSFIGNFPDDDDDDGTYGVFEVLDDEKKLIAYYTPERGIYTE